MNNRKQRGEKRVKMMNETMKKMPKWDEKIKITTKVKQRKTKGMYLLIRVK